MTNPFSHDAVVLSVGIALSVFRATIPPDGFGRRIDHSHSDATLIGELETRSSIESRVESDSDFLLACLQLMPATFAILESRAIRPFLCHRPLR